MRSVENSVFICHTSIRRQRHVTPYVNKHIKIAHQGNCFKLLCLIIMMSFGFDTVSFRQVKIVPEHDGARLSLFPYRNEESPMMSIFIGV